jgi:iron complex outermembrane receptor protein
VISKYVFNYPSHNGVLTWMAQFRGCLAVRARVGVMQRIDHDSYPVWDLAASRTNGRLRPYVQLSNLSNTGYEEIPGVRMPGRSVVGGIELLFRSSGPRH